MMTGEIRNKVDQIWNTFWSGGVSNPLSVIEQITYLLFAKRLDDIHNNRLQQAKLLGEKIENPIFNKNQDHLRWSRFKDFEPLRKFEVFRDEVFPFIKSLNGRAGSSYTKFMKDAVFILFSEEGPIPREEYNKLFGDRPMGVLVRSVVGLDRNAAKTAFAEFLSEAPLHPDQITFLDEVVNYLVKNGVMEPKTMFETPFTNINDQGVVGVFGESVSEKIIETLKHINRNADVA